MNTMPRKDGTACGCLRGEVPEQDGLPHRVVVGVRFSHGVRVDAEAADELAVGAAAGIRHHSAVARPATIGFDHCRTTRSSRLPEDRDRFSTATMHRPFADGGILGRFRLIGQPSWSAGSGGSDRPVRRNCGSRGRSPRPRGTFADRAGLQLCRPPIRKIPIEFQERWTPCRVSPDRLREADCSRTPSNAGVAAVAATDREPDEFLLDPDPAAAGRAAAASWTDGRLRGGRRSV